MKAILGIVGGSGIYDLPELRDFETLSFATPWGQPSAPLKKGMIGGTEIVFLPRHGEGHRISPSEINYRANIDALKRAGVTDLVSLSACGSLREDLAPGSFVLVDQFIDQTRRRATSFFGTGCVAHVSMADPVSPLLADRLEIAARDVNLPIRRGGTYIAIEGPQFSTRAESRLYRSQDIDVIGMTAMPEAKLAREAEMSFALVAMVTDFDCWQEAHDAVDADMVSRVMKKNTEKARGLIVKLATDFPSLHEPCPVGSDRALDHAIMTARDKWDPELMRKLDVVASRILTNSAN